MNGAARFVLATTALALVACCIVSPVLADDDQAWKAGFARVNITPQERIFLAGYASRNKPFENVESELFAKALALEDADGHKAVIVTSDLIGFRGAVADPICERIMQKTGLARSDILLNSSHTHTGPNVSLDAEARGNMSAEDARRVVAYTEQLQDKVVELAVAALADLAPAKLSWGSGVAHFVMNRREFTPSGVRLGVNARGFADRSVPLLRIDSPEGKLRGVLFGFAAHNTTLGGNHYFVCGDYAGYAQQHVEAQFPDATAMFMLGCAGSANPYPRGELEYSKQHGAELGSEVCRLLETSLAPIDGELRTEFDHVALPLQAGLSREQIEQLLKQRGGWQPWVAEKMIELLDEGKKLPESYSAPLAVWRFGDGLTLAALSGEVVGEYVPLIEEALGPLNLWISAYNNDVYGYLPTAGVLQQGGYETRGMIYGGIGFFAPSAQDELLQKLREMAARAGRELP